MPEPVSMKFATPPSMWMAYPRMFLAQRPTHVPKGREVPPIEARIVGLASRADHLKSYRRVCGFSADGRLPLTYPHVMSMPVKMAMLTSDAFPVRLLGLVHVRNEITSLRPIADQETLDIRCAVSGPRETDRGQEFDMLTEASADGKIVWSEISTFLARRRAPRTTETRKSATQPNAGEAAAAVRTTSWHADADIGRRYAGVSGDINPIHLMDLTARLFGFERAIAHGMWSLARTAAELHSRVPTDSLRLSASFKLPILLPAWVNLQSWDTATGIAFSLRDAQGEKPHIAGAIDRA